MKLIHTIAIDASIETVWRVVTDVERWPEWTATMERVQRVDSGPFVVGSEARIKQPGMPECVWCVTEMTPGKTFTWETTSRGIKFVGSHVLDARPSGCASELRLEMSGLVATLLWPIVKRSARQALITENTGLKNWCEGNANSARE